MTIARKRLAGALFATVLLLAGCGGGAAPSTAPPAGKAPASSSGTAAKPAAAASSTFRLGVLIPESGFLAAPGKFMKEGIDLYLKQHNDVLGGRKVQVFYGDTAGNPATGLTEARKLVEQDHVDLLFGPLSAAVGEAVLNFATANKVPALYPIVSDDNMTQRKPSPYLVRTGWTSSQTTMPLGDYTYKTLHYKTAATIGYDFSFGWQSVGGFMYTFQKDGGKVKKVIWGPLTTTNFSPYLSEIPKNVDVVFCSWSGSTAIRFFQQYKAFGLKIPLVCQGNATDESTLQQTGPSAIGVIGAQQYSAALDTPANKAFVAAYTKAYGHGPSYYGEGTYVGGMVLGQALDSLKGKAITPLGLVAAMKNANLTGAPRGSVTFDKYGNPVQNIYIRKVQEVNGKLQNTVIHTYHHVSQFWTFNPQQFLKHPVFSRTYPPCNACTTG